MKQDEDVIAQEEPDHEKDRAHAGHVSDAACSDRISASTSAGCESLERTSDVEIVTFQDPRKRNKLKRAVEPEPRVSRNLCISENLYIDYRRRI